MSHFNEVANEWDSPEKRNMMQRLAQKTKEQLSLNKKLSIMDFGCGTGLFGLEFSEYAERLVGIDNSVGMLKVFEQKTANQQNFSSHCIDLEHETITDHFDLIVSSMTFHHLESPQALLSKLVALLSNNGKIAIVDLDQEDGTFHPNNEGMGVKHFGFSKDVLEEWAKVLNLKFEWQIINKIEKNDKLYQQFLAVFEK